MGLITSAIVLGLLAEIGKGIATDSIKDKIKNYFIDQRDEFEKDLLVVINNTIEEYKTTYPIVLGDDPQKFSFIESQGLIDNLLKFSFFNEDKLDPNKDLDQYDRIIQANESEIKKILEIFHKNIEASENLKELEITSRSSFILSRVYQKVKEIKEEVELLRQDFADKGSGELSEEYNSTLLEYENDILNFRPKSALRHLLSLKKRMEERGFNDTNLLSKVNHFIGRAYGDVFNIEECAKHYILSYELSKDSPHYKLYGAIGYLAINDIDKTIELLDELIAYNSFNHRAQAMKSSLVPGYYEEVPTYLKIHKDFKYYYANLLFNDNKTKEAFEIMKDEFHEFESCEITADNYRRIIFVSQLNFFSFYSQSKSTTLFHWQEPNEEIEALDFAINRLEALFEKVQNTEVYEDYREVFFFLKFATYSKLGNPATVDQMLEIYNKLPNIVKVHRCENMALSLSQQKRFPEALALLEESDFGNSPYNLYVAAQLSIMQNEQEKTSTYLKRFVLESNSFDDLVINCSGEYLSTYCPENERVEFVNNLKSKCTTDDILYLECLIDLIDNKNWESEKCQELYDSLTSKDESKKRMIAINLLRIKDLNNALKVIDKEKEVVSDSINADILIDILNELKIQSQRLLKLLQEKRNVKIYPHWLEIELNLLYSISNWKEVIKLSEEGLKELPEALLLVEFLVLSLFKENRVEEISPIITKYKDSPNWTQNSAFQLANILTRCELYDLALDITYPFAKEKDNTKARENYAFGLGLKITNKEHVGLKNIVVDTIIEIKINDNIRILEVTNGALKNNPIISSIADWTVGDEGTIDSGERVQLISISSLKYGLIKQIIHDIGEREDVGYSVKSFSINGDKPEDLLKQLHDLIGDDEIERKEHQKRILQEYNEGKESLSIIAKSLFNGNYINAYNFLTGPNCKFNVKPNAIFNQLTFDSSKNYVLDWSSIILFFHLDNNGVVKFSKNSFTISNRIVEELEDIIYQESRFPSSITLHFNESEVLPILYPENAVDLRIKFYEELKEWINHTCILDKVPEKLETIVKLKENQKFNGDVAYLLDTVFLLDRKDHILISDDIIWGKFGLIDSGKVLSTQYYLSKSLPSLWSSSVVKELLNLSYFGITITNEILKSVYMDLSDFKAKKFLSALKNIPFKVGQNRNIIGEVLEFIKYIYSLDIKQVTKKRVSMQIFSYLIIDLDMTKVKINIENLIRMKFTFHQEILPSVLEDFRSTF